MEVPRAVLEKPTEHPLTSLANIALKTTTFVTERLKGGAYAALAETAYGPSDTDAPAELARDGIARFRSRLTGGAWGDLADQIAIYLDENAMEQVPSAPNSTV